MILEYRNTRADYRDQYELVWGDAYRQSRAAHYQSVAVWYGVLLLAGYTAFRAEQVFLMCIFVAAALWTLPRYFPYSRIYWVSVEQACSDRPETDIRLEVKEGGLHESMDGIESFVPWSSIKGFTLFHNTLFVFLSAGLCAIIPRSSLKPGPAAIDDLVKILRERGIAETPAPLTR